jgi:hypothetical protein
VERPEAHGSTMASKKQRSQKAVNGKTIRYADASELEAAVRRWAFDRRVPARPAWTADQARFMRDHQAEKLRSVARAKDPDRDAAEALELWGAVFRALTVYSNAEHRLAPQYKPEKLVRHVYGVLRELATWPALNELEDNPPRKRRGRSGSGPLAELVRAARAGSRRRPTSDEIDDMTADAVIAGLMDVDAIAALVGRAKRDGRAYPTLTDGIETVRKRVRHACERMA